MEPKREQDRVLGLFAEHVYGVAPQDPWNTHWNLVTEHVTSSGMRRQQWRLEVSTMRGAVSMIVLIDLPPEGGSSSDVGEAGVPAFLGLNFYGNHTLSDDAAIVDVSAGDPQVVGQLYDRGLREQIQFPVARGEHRHRWPSEVITARGYGAVAACYLQLGPDSLEIFDQGIYPLFSDTHLLSRPANYWSGLGIWAWAMQRILDGIQQGMLPGIDPSRVMAVGHSRLGKAALWAAATDTRFAGVISNNSGCMGAAISRPVGETPELLARVRPYWFNHNFNLAMQSHPETLALDQPQLLELIAPRPLYVASASEDAPADPEGEFASWLVAAQAWTKSETSANISLDFPKPDNALTIPGYPLGYHLRRGGHDMTPWDWEQWLNFADQWL